VASEPIHPTLKLTALLVDPFASFMDLWVFSYCMSYMVCPGVTVPRRTLSVHLLPIVDLCPFASFVDLRPVASFMDLSPFASFLDLKH
jgi:hypothetical protein